MLILFQALHHVLIVDKLPGDLQEQWPILQEYLVQAAGHLEAGAEFASEAQKRALEHKVPGFHRTRK